MKQLFTLSGGHISPILCASEKLGIRIVDVRHEVNAVFAADAVARLSGTIGVAAVTAGPGLTNTITAIKNAQMAESPILLLGGAAANLLKGRGALQDIDQMSLFKSLCKYTATIRYVRDIPGTLREAIKIAQSGTPGPVFVEFPIDTLYPIHLVQRELGVKEGPTNLMQKVVNAYLNNYLKSLFAGAFDKKEFTPLKTDVPLASQSQIQQAVELLKTAKRPVILLGSQATLPPMPAEKLRESLEKLNAPCFLGGMARGLLGKDSEIQFKHCRKDALKEADVVILAGTVADFRLGYGKVLSKKSKIISINRSKEQLTKNSDMFWKPTLAFQADPASFVVKLAEATKNFKGSDEWLKTLREKDNVKDASNKQKASEPTNVHLNPIKILRTLDQILPDNAILVADGGDFVATAAYNLRPRSAGSWLDPGAFGTLGVGGGFALGAKIVRPESEVWIIYGDGSCGYSIAEIDTFTRHKLPVISIVGNDAGWTQIARDQIVFFGSSVACDLAYTDYDVVAKGFGGVGLKMDRSNDSNIEEVLQLARKEHASGKSVLINALIGKTDFRDGSLSV